MIYKALHGIISLRVTNSTDDKITALYKKYYDEKIMDGEIIVISSFMVCRSLFLCLTNVPIVRRVWKRFAYFKLCFNVKRL